MSFSAMSTKMNTYNPVYAHKSHDRTRQSSQAASCAASEPATVIHRNQEHDNGTVSATESFTVDRKETVNGGTEQCTETMKKRRTHRGPRRPRPRKPDTDVPDEDEVHSRSGNGQISIMSKPVSKHLDSCGQHKRELMELSNSSSTTDLQDPFLDHGRDAVGISSPARCSSSSASRSSQSPVCTRRNIHLINPFEIEHTQELERCLRIHGILLNRVNALPVWDGSDLIFRAFHDYLGRCEKSLHALKLRSPSADTAFSVSESEANKALFEACTDSLTLLAMRVLEIEIQIGGEDSEVEDAATDTQKLASSGVYAIVEERGLGSQKDLAIHHK